MSVLAWGVYDAGWTVQHQTFDAFGNLEGGSQPIGSIGLLPTIWAGHQLDVDTGFYHAQWRWYDPTTGRFLSQDPTSLAAGDANLYRYAGNDPVNSVDPTGLEETWIDTVGSYSKTGLDMTSEGGYALFVTGPKGLWNGAANTVVGFATLGQYEAPEWATFQGDRFDQMAGIETSSLIARVPGEITLTLGTGGLSHVAKTGTVLRVARGAVLVDAAGNVVQTAQGVDNAMTEGSSLRNLVQIVGGSLGIAGGARPTMKALEGFGEDLSRLPIKFDRATLSMGGLGGVRLRQLPDDVAEAIETGQITVQKMPRNSQVHHLASPEDSAYAPQFDRLFLAAGEDLRTSVFNRTRLKGHVGPHGKFSNGVVLERLNRATEGKGFGTTEFREALLDELWKLRRDVQNTELGDLYRAPASRVDVMRVN